jgi:hypothetical protein
MRIIITGSCLIIVVNPLLYGSNPAVSMNLKLNEPSDPVEKPSVKFPLQLIHSNRYPKP